MALFKRLFGKKEQQETIDEGLQKTREGFLGKLTKAIAGKSKVDDEVLDSIEDALVSADVGVETTVKIIDRLEARVARDKYMNTDQLNGILKAEMQDMLISAPQDDSYIDYQLPKGHSPHVILVVGVNGVGKTTTIGKLAHNFSQAGKKVVLGAADTFRAAAVDQLTIWSERTGVDIVKKEMGSDPASVAFDTVKSGLAKGADVVIIDTAGRLHNKAHLMDELSKIKKVIQKSISGSAARSTTCTGWQHRAECIGAGKTIYSSYRCYSSCHHQVGWYCQRRCGTGHCKPV